MNHDEHGEAHAEHAEHEHEALEANALSTESVYHLGGSWTDEDGESFELESLRGHATVVLFFYGSCEHVCPMLISDVQAVEAALDPDVLENTRFLLVTIDPATDTPELRRAMAETKELSQERYTLAHSDEMHTRGLAALLGVQYRDNGDGQFSHSNIISLLDPNGVPVTRIEGLQQPNEDFVRALVAAAGS